MHSEDLGKDLTAFQLEFERILAEAEENRAVADFQGFVFTRPILAEREYRPACSFHFAKFTLPIDFSRATFTQAADFRDTNFTQSADFNGATFTQGANFNGATFTRGASFCGAKFTQNVDFSEAVFEQDAFFCFREGIDLSWAQFSEAAFFRNTEFRHGLSRSVGLDFSNVTLEHPEKVEFYDVDLGQAVFVNTDVSRVDFALVHWRKRGNGRYCLFEEDVEMVGAVAKLTNGGDGNALIAETYQQLKRNYDAKGNYWLAGHFHYGEMEMLRLHSERNWAPLRWLERNLGLTALYKYASAYGESMTRPLAWLAVIVLVVFPLLYPATAGLEVNPGVHEQGLTGWRVNYWNAKEYFDEHPDEIHLPEWIGRATAHHAAAPLLMHSAMASISVAGFQKELRYAPSYLWGRALALLELLLTTTVGGLFLLAVRRQYKRS
jgi:uncharacterized protein YjbI with pentapeptide repeats